ncbi:Fusaric acid resistance protein-like-domain-containing protein [Amylostereum chailletii]|nr:Fusaric acid resistance protein-like-domain-containing protein [Amylostereum chailletii]
MSPRTPTAPPGVSHGANPVIPSVGSSGPASSSITASASLQPSSPSAASVFITPATPTRLPRPIRVTPSPREEPTSSPIRRMTMEIKRMTRASERPPEWTVFGQVMENEGQLATPGGSASRMSMMSQGQDNARPRLRTEDSYISGYMFEEDDTGYTATSPVEDPHMASRVPSVADEDEAEEEVEESCSEGDDSSDDQPSPPTGHVPWYSLSRLPTLSPMQRNILKCTLAYFIASLFTYCPYLSGLIAVMDTGGPGEKYPSPSGHMVATIMNLYWALETHAGWEWLADILALIWIGIGMSMVAWMKLWMAKPTFNPACSMIAIILFVVVVKEGGLATLLSVSFIVVVGSVIANVVCYTVWPQSAASNLQANMIKTLDSYSTLLKLLTNTFLLEEPLHRLSQEKIKKAVADHQASFTKLKKDLAEAKSEAVWESRSGNVKQGRRRPYEDAVDSMTRLGQHLNGLRSGITLQYDIAKAYRDGKLAKRRSFYAKDPKARHSTIGPSTVKGKGQDPHLELEDDELTVMIKSVAAIFGDIVDELGPPLHALSTTCTHAIKRLRHTFVHRNHTTDTEVTSTEFLELVDGVERALFVFDSTSNQAIMRLYRRSSPSGHATHNTSLATSRASIASLVDDSVNPFTVGTDNENVFLVYFFIFTLQEFASELVSLIDAMSRIYAAERRRAKEGPWFKRIPSEIFTYCRRARVTPRDRNSQPSKAGRPSFRRTVSEYLNSNTTRVATSFPKVRPHAPNTMQTPSRSELSYAGRFKQWIWRVGARMGDHDIKYAIKAGMATAMLAAPAFFEVTRPKFMEYRGEWVLISFFVVMSPTIGATNFLSVHRVLGTLFGAATAAGVYALFPENAIVLSIFGFFFSIPCFYYIIALPQYATTGRFVLLTYNLTCLYSYNLRRKDVSVLDIAYHRFVAVTVGVVWAAFVSRFWWPSEARRELSKALGEFCLNLGWLYTRLVASNSFSPDLPPEDEDEAPTEETALVPRKPKTRLSNSVEEFMAMELHLQIKLIELQELLKQTQHEPRLKGPFPIKLYRSILTSLQTILDRMHSMRCVTTREEWHTTVRRDFIIPVNPQRREMVGNVILYFTTLASAFRLKSPPSTVDAIRKLDVVRNRDIKGSRQLLFFAYALTMKGITQELDLLGKTSQDAFGVIGPGTEAFEEMFRDSDRQSADLNV